MATAPYEPFPTAQPYMRPTPMVRLDVPGAAFGENIGAALNHLGASVEGAGKELFDRATALQELQNENDARDAQVQYDKTIAPLQAQFDARVGKDSSDNLQAHLDNLDKIRQQFRGQLKTPMAQKLFDQDSLPFYQRNLFASSARAGQQFKEYTIQTHEAVADLAIRDAENHPDDITFQKSKGIIARNTADAASIRYGVDENDPIVQDKVEKATAAHVASQIKGIARTEPIRAMTMLEANKDALGDQYDALHSLVETRGNAVASANIVNGVIGSHYNPGDRTYDATDKQMQDEVRAKAAELYPNNQLLQIEVVNGLDHRLNQDRYARDNDTRDTRNALDNMIVNHPEVMNNQDLLAVPGADKIIGKLSDYDRQTLDQRIANLQRKQYSEAWKVNDVQARGLMSGNVQKFLEQDFGNWQLSPDRRAYYQQQQQILAQKPSQDPRVSQAMGILHTAFATQLETMGVDPKEKNDPQSNYNHFVGSLQEQLEMWQHDHGKPASYADIVGPIFQQLQATTLSHHYLWKDTTDYTYKQYVKPTMEQIPQDFKEKVQAEATKQGKPMLSDSELYQYYLREEFIRLFGSGNGGTSAKPTNTTGSPGKSGKPAGDIGPI